MCGIMGIQEVCDMLTPEGYKPRLIDLQIDRLMKIYGAVYALRDLNGAAKHGPQEITR